MLILDEPAASLDPLARRQFLQMIIDLAEPGKRTVLFSTHITSDLEHVADRVAILKSGRIAWQGLLEDLKEQTHVSLEESFLEMHNGTVTMPTELPSPSGEGPGVRAAGPELSATVRGCVLEWQRRLPMSVYLSPGVIRLWRRETKILISFSLQPPSEGATGFESEPIFANKPILGPLKGAKRKKILWIAFIPKA